MHRNHKPVRQPINPTEADEKEYLGEIILKLDATIDYADRSVNAHAADVKEITAYLWEHKESMDRMEKFSVGNSIRRTAITGESVKAKKERMMKLKASPYFGRIDFTQQGKENPLAVYIGLYAFYDPEVNELLIHDWRAPISGMFYDFDTGEAAYESPSGQVAGKITLKRQFRIRRGVMEFMIESDMSIHDDILQKELSLASDDRMKTIVATIQREQNSIIRNELAPVLIIQGVAGSGKTSIALHRIAFLLYRFKQTLTADEVLIISPNKVFADYISTVLPELGEESIPEKSMETLAAELLEHRYRFRTFHQQVNRLVEKEDAELARRIEFKSSPEMIRKLNEFVVFVENEYFTPADIFIARMPVPSWFVEERFRANQRLPLLKRLPAVVKEIAENILFYYKKELSTAHRHEITKAVNSMFRTTSLRNLYRDFFDWAGMPEMLKYSKGSAYEFNDVYPLIYLKILLEGIRPYYAVKHLLIDEMQDYSPVQYTVLARVFPCNKTILGDASQSLNPYGTSTAEEIGKVFSNALTVRLNKSYRSTMEITDFARQIIPNPDLEPLLRHGHAPEMIRAGDKNHEVSILTELVASFRTSDYLSLGIIAKTEQQADTLVRALEKHNIMVNHLNEESVAFSQGVVVSTPYLVKGLEFDQVVVPFCNKKNYHTNLDRHLLYVACTRAMHRLEITWTGELTELLSETTTRGSG
ncbi:MAG: 3'-5' exonuclease [Bacteroidales bacterium]